jgi:hypothetical protein
MVAPNGSANLGDMAPCQRLVRAFYAKSQTSDCGYAVCMNFLAELCCDANIHPNRSDSDQLYAHCALL